MNNFGEQLQPGQQPASSNNKPLWAAVGILGVAVLGMGGTMIYNQRAPAPVVAAAPVATVAALTPAPVALPLLPAPVEKAAVADDLVEKPAAAAVQPAPVPAPAPVKKVVKHVPKPQPQPPRELTYSQVGPAGSGYSGGYNAPAPYQVQAAVCHACGTIESVTPITRSTKPEGVGIGTVAGGLLGAVLGNQMGHGGGRAAATVLGAVGGGFAGNAIEGNMHKETIYQVGVRMEDGSRRVVELANAPAVGAPVTVEGSTLRAR